MRSDNKSNTFQKSICYMGGMFKYRCISLDFQSPSKMLQNWGKCTKLWSLYALAMIMTSDCLWGTWGCLECAICLPWRKSLHIRKGLARVSCVYCLVCWITFVNPLIWNEFWTRNKAHNRSLEYTTKWAHPGGGSMVMVYAESWSTTVCRMPYDGMRLKLPSCPVLQPFNPKGILRLLLIMNCFACLFKLIVD